MNCNIKTVKCNYVLCIYFFQVAKNRYSGDLGVMPLEFQKDSLSYGHKKRKIVVEGDSPDQT